MTRTRPLHAPACSAIALTALAAAAVAQAQAPASVAALAGRWSQASSGDELVLKPKIKLTPAYTPSMGMSLGGSVGYGSATTTVLATEPALMKVSRTMELNVQPDGRFAWTVQRAWAESAGCTRTVRQEKRGTVSVQAGAAVFAVAGGSEISKNSCGGESRSAVAPSQERYSLGGGGASLSLSGPSTRWTFTRG